MAMVPTGQSGGDFFWSLLSRIEANGHTQQTNLQDIVQDADEWVAILESRHHASFFINQTIEFTYLRSIWDPRHLYRSPAPVAKVLRKGFCCCPEPGPEEDALRSEASDEDALVCSLGWTCLSIRQRKD